MSANMLLYIVLYMHYIVDRERLLRELARLILFCLEKDHFLLLPRPLAGERASGREGGLFICIYYSSLVLYGRQRASEREGCTSAVLVQY